MLDEELKTYQENIDKLRAENPHGGFVVIKDKEILGVWASREDALKEAGKAYGDDVFLIKDINDLGSVLNFTRPIFRPIAI